MKPTTEVKWVKRQFIVTTHRRSFVTDIEVPIEDDVLDIVYNKVDKYLRETYEDNEGIVDIIDPLTMKHIKID